jgi:hypothetical protein
VKYAIFRQYIVTANDDGAIPLNARVVLEFSPRDDLDAIKELVEKANHGLRAWSWPAP